jgi:hypothetical protein
MRAFEAGDSPAGRGVPGNGGSGVGRGLRTDVSTGADRVEFRRVRRPGEAVARRDADDASSKPNAPADPPSPRSSKRRRWPVTTNCSVLTLRPPRPSWRSRHDRAGSGIADARALRAPRISEAFRRLGDQARDAGWSHEEHSAAVLSKEVSERESSGAVLRIKAARFPGHETLEDFNFDRQPSADRDLIAHLGTSVFLTEAKNVVLLGPHPRDRKTHLAVGIGIEAAKAGHRVLFDTATGWVNRLQEAHSRGKLAVELIRAALLQPADRRRGRVHPLRPGRRELVLPARVIPLRTRVVDHDEQPALRPLERRVR